jgi:hypothetical protein
MENFIASGILIGIVGALAWMYLSVYFDAKKFNKKVDKYEQIKLYSLILRNRRKRKNRYTK